MVRNFLYFIILLRIKRYSIDNYFLLLALNITGDLKLNTAFDQEFFTNKLITEQNSDGSWHQLVDLNKKEGSLDATIFNCNFMIL